MQYTGAEVYGNITLKIFGKTKFYKRFRGKHAPDKEISQGYWDDPSDAPCGLAYMNADCDEILIEMISVAWAPELSDKKKIGKIEGNVLRSDTSQPIDSAVVFLKYAMSQNEKINEPTFDNVNRLLRDENYKKNIFAKTTTDMQGRYSFEVIPGKYYILVRANFQKNSTLPCNETIANTNTGCLITKVVVKAIIAEGALKTTVLLIAQGDNFDIKAGDLLQKDIDLNCTK